MDKHLTCFFREETEDKSGIVVNDGVPIIDDHSSHTTFISDSEVLCCLPKGLLPGTYAVHVSNIGFSDDSHSPSIGRPGNPGMVIGKSFHPHMNCQVGNQIVETSYVNSTMI